MAIDASPTVKRARSSHRLLLRHIAKHLMIEDGILCTISTPPGRLQSLLEQMTPTDRRATQRRYRKAWRSADKNKVLRWKDPRSDYIHSFASGNWNEAVNTKLLTERSRTVHRYYLDRARNLLCIGQQK